MTRDEMTKSFREATKAPPVGAQQRVWRALQEPATPRRSAWVPVLALAASALVGVGVVKLVQSRTSSVEWSDERSAIAWNDARAQRTERRVTLEAGEVAVSSWGAPVEVAARGHVVRVEAGVTVVRVAGESVSVEVIEGALLLDGAEQVAKAKSVSSSPALTALEAVETPALRSRRLLRRAERAITEQRFDDASGDLETVATSGSLDAEVANFKKADLELRRLGNPTRALATLEAGEARFPTGALSQERQLTALESCAKLERWAEVERRATDFLTQHPDSERRAEIEALRDGARARMKSR